MFEESRAAQQHTTVETAPRMQIPPSRVPTRKAAPFGSTKRGLESNSNWARSTGSCTFAIDRAKLEDGAKGKASAKIHLDADAVQREANPEAVLSRVGNARRRA